MRLTIAKSASRDKRPMADLICGTLQARAELP
jgi:hypothetical protein